MIRRVSDVIRLLLISPEALWVAVVLGFYHYVPRYFAFLGEVLANQNQIVLPLCLATWGIVAFAVAKARELLVPNDAMAKILAKWGDHHQLRDRGLATILICAICASFITAGVVFRTSIAPARLGLIVLIGLVGAMISAWCLLLATFEVRRLLDEADSSRPS